MVALPDPHQYFTFREDCFFLQDSKNGSLTVTLIILDEDNVYFRITLVAAEVFLAFNKRASTATFNEIVESILPKYPEKHHARIREEPLSLLQNLMTHKIVSVKA